MCCISQYLGTLGWRCAPIKAAMLQYLRASLTSAGPGQSTEDVKWLDDLLRELFAEVEGKGIGGLNINVTA